MHDKSVELHAYNNESDILTDWVVNEIRSVYYNIVHDSLYKDNWLCTAVYIYTRAQYTVQPCLQNTLTFVY